MNQLPVSYPWPGEFIMDFFVSVSNDGGQATIEYNRYLINCGLSLIVLIVATTILFT